MCNSIDKKLTIRTDRDSVLASLPLLFYLANLYKMISGSMMVYYAVFLAAGIMGLVILLSSGMHDFSRLMWFGVLYVVTGVINHFSVSNMRLLDVALSFLLFGITVVMLTKKWTVFFAGLTFYSTFLALLIRIYFKGDNALTISSNNYISILIIIAAALYYIALENERQKIKLIDILPAILSFVLSVLASGRGGILSAGILLMCILLIYIGTLGKRTRRKIWLIIILALVVFLLAGGLGRFSNWFMTLGKFSSAGFNSDSRITIWDDYLTETFLSAKHVLIGAPKECIQILDKYNGNLHNSFLQLHSANGLIMLLVLAVDTICSIKAYICKKEYLKLSLLMVVIIRGMTDAYIFGTYGMPLILFLIYCPLTGKKPKGLQPFPPQENAAQKS